MQVLLASRGLNVIHSAVQEKELSYVGAELVRVAKDKDPSPQQVLQELFPYVFEASRQMSTRAISRWLKESHNLHISQATLSRALRNPRRHWQWYVELIEPAARIVEEAIGKEAREFLFNYPMFASLVHEPIPVHGEVHSEITQELSEFDAAVDFLRRHWFGFEPRTLSHCREFFQISSEDEAETAAENGAESDDPKI